MTDPVSLVLTEAVQRQELRALAEAQGWKPVDDRIRTHESFRSLTWEAGPGRQVSWIEDHAYGLRFVVAHPELAPAVKKALPTVSREEALRLARGGDPVDLLRGLRLLARMDGEHPGPDHRALLEQALRHPQPVVRRGTWRVLALAGGRALLPSIERAGRDDPDPDVRELFQKLAGLLQEPPPKEPSKKESGKKESGKKKGGKKK